ncbi:LppX_LprAFG lipoprotein [Mycobacterium sp. MYCO198283]|uniref:LppX_LprAFG lipoprotein n=1 Tax=Mycobacterium sp. MYCO198283 TaxID=2883505 RepID=UPI001E2C1189|nr:LppX_LprAFG lipoprotein [Mycobacterium sp. MYCO198283]MCG5433601.1 LppX_LprAFG lipoprotein [Mycobacterium sp. MYCO198283]
MHSMPKRRLSAVLAAALLSAGLLAGCSKDGGSKDTGNLPDAATLLQQSSETTRGQQSVHLLLRTTGTQVQDALPIERLEGDLTNVPQVAAQGNADLGGSFAGAKNLPFVVADGNLYAAFNTGGQPKLVGPAAEIYDVSLILNPDTGLANVLGSFTDPKSEGRDDVAGVKTVRVTGQVSADAVNKIAPALGVTEPVPGTAWIREDGDHELVQAKLEPSSGNSIEMTTTEWGKPVTVTKPPA